MGICLASGAAQWIVRTALPMHLPGAPNVRDPTAVSARGAVAMVDGPAAMQPPPPVLSELCQLPLLRTQRAAVELLVTLVLRCAKVPICTQLIEKMGVARNAIDQIQRQHHELSAALDLGSHCPRVFLQEYDESRERRLALWNALLRTPGEEFSMQLRTSNAVDRLILTGALPYTRAFELPLLKLPASFVPHHNGMALRQEGLVMLHALLEKRFERPELYNQLLFALQRDRIVPREVSKLNSAITNVNKLKPSDEVVMASVVTLMLLLDSVRDLALWQLMQEADAARTIHNVHLNFPEIASVPLEKLLEPGPQTLQRPLFRAASTFIEALKEYERTNDGVHPLMTGKIRGGV